MTDQIAFLGDKRKAVFAATGLAVLLLLPASLGFGGTIIQEAFAQFNLPLLEDEETAETEDGDLVVEEGETTTPPTTTTTTPPTTTTTTPATTGNVDPAAYMLAERNVNPLRGFIGTTLPEPGAGGNAPTGTDGSGYVVTGRNRIFANDSSVESFVTEMNIAAIDGSSIHNITIREGEPSTFEATAGNDTGSASSSIVGSIFINGAATPAIENVPMTLTVRGQVLAIEGIDIDENAITDPTQRQILSIIDGRTIYGTLPRT